MSKQSDKAASKPADEAAIAASENAPVESQAAEAAADVGDTSEVLNPLQACSAEHLLGELEIRFVHGLSGEGMRPNSIPNVFYQIREACISFLMERLGANAEALADTLPSVAEIIANAILVGAKKIRDANAAAGKVNPASYAALASSKNGEVVAELFDRLRDPNRARPVLDNLKTLLSGWVKEWGPTLGPQLLQLITGLLSGVKL